MIINKVMKLTIKTISRPVKRVVDMSLMRDYRIEIMKIVEK